MKHNTPKVPVTFVAELRAERAFIEDLLDQTPSIKDQPDSLRWRRDALCEAIERLEERGDGGPLLSVTLNAYASAIVRRVLREQANTTEADVVNAALVFKWGEKDDHDAEEELAAARVRRYTAGGDNGKEVA